MLNEFCTRCGSLKTGSYLKEYVCGKCKEAYRTERRKKKREDADLPPFGSGRDPKCKKCRKVKEEGCLNGSLCKACRAERARERYAKIKEVTGKIPYSNKNPVCPCGKPKKDRRSYCTECSTKYDRNRRNLLMKDPEYRKMLMQKELKRFHEDAEYQKKVLCRKQTKKAIRSKVLLRMPCETCGEIKAEAHHDDYDQPFNVRWLCRKHHGDHHQSIKEQTK
jgi:hypothetical protein